MAVDMSTFWSDWGVACGNQVADNWYDTFKGLKMIDDTIVYNFQEFIKWNNEYWGENYNRYTFFKAYNGIDPNIIDEKTFYQNIDDVNIWDFKTFYEIAPSYFPANCNPTPPVNKFIIAYKNTQIPYISFDGINWNEITIDTLGNYTASVGCNAKNSQYYLMGGQNNVIRYDINNDVWENFGTTITLHDLAYDPDNGKFIGLTRGVTTNNIHISSDNGQSWTTYSSGSQFDCIGYSEGYLRYYASVNGASNKRVSTSSDGITWAAQITSAGAAATYDGRYYDSVDVNGNILFVPSAPVTGNKFYFIQTNDFSTWNTYEYSTNSDLRGGTFNNTNDKLVFMGEANKQSLIGGDVSLLSASNAPITYQYTDIAYFQFGDIFVAGTRASDVADTNKKLLYSTSNGLNWVKVDGITGNFSNILVIE